MRSCTQCLSPYTQDVEFCGIDGARLIETDTDPLVGNDVDRYRILQHIGDGGMARVYRARHHTLDREVAVKVLFGEFASNRTVAERFRREAQTISRIDHENIVGVTDFGRTAQGLTFLAMELVRGKTIRRMVKSTGALEPAFVARVSRQIALGLHAAHEQGFVHRDLKPGNVMVVGDAPDEIVKILDFGLARMADDDNEPYLTRTGQFLGTPIYMAPEQIVGADVDHRADLYSLGVLMFEMLEGRPPFTAKKVAAIREQHLLEVPASVRPSGGLEHVVAQLLAKDADQRPLTAKHVVGALDALPGDPQPTEVQPVPVDIASTSLGAAHVAASQEGPTEVAAQTEGPTVAAPAEAMAHAASVPAGRRRAWTTALLTAAVATVAGLALARWINPQPRGRAVASAPVPPPLTPAPDEPRPEPAADPAEVMDAAPPPPTPKRRRRRARARPTKKRRALKRRTAARLDEALTSRGLVRGDLSRSDVTAPAYARWRAARGRDDVAAWRETTDALVAQVRAYPLTRELVDRRLGRIVKRLEAAAAVVPAERLRPLEDRYLAIAEQVAPGMTEADVRRTLERTDALLTAVNRALPR